MRSLLGATVLTAMLCLTALPADAQFVHRNRDGTISINPLLCFTDYQVRRAVAAQGFSNIFLNPSIESHQQVRASKGGVTYLIDFDICRGRIVGISRLR